MSEQTQAGSAAGGAGASPARPIEGASGTAGESARRAGTEAVAATREVVDDAKTRGASLTGEVKERVASTAEEGKENVAERLDDVAKAARHSASELEGQQDWIAHLVERGADELGNLAATLRTNDLQGLLGKLEDLARRQPAVFVGAAMAAGFATGRLGKAVASGASREDLPKMPDIKVSEARHESE